MKTILTCCQIHRGCTIEVHFGEKAGGRIPWPDPDLKPHAERDFPGLVPIQVKHLLKDRNAKTREDITALTDEVEELREENMRLLDQLVAAGFHDMSDHDAAYKRLRCEVCSGHLHVVDRAGPTLECEDCRREWMWDDHEKRVIPSHLKRPEPVTP